MTSSVSAVLGRGIVVRPGGDVPDAWRTAERVSIDEPVLDDGKAVEALVDRLHQCWVSRTPVVVEWAVADDALAGDESTTEPPWRLGADFLFPLERLRFLCFSNNYDARNGTPRWWWVTKAARLGVVDGGPGDALLPDGSAVWIDGGPRQPLPALDLPVVHGESVETGALTPVSRIPVAGADTTDLDLADDQAAAVRHLVGPARIIAPAGSGKTRTLTARLRHLLDGTGVEPENLVAVAYNERAAAEMRNRLDVGRDLARTIHSLGWEILRQARPGLGLVEEREVRAMLESLVTVAHRANADPYGPYLEALSQVRSRLRDPEEVEASRDDVAGFADAFERLRERMYAGGSVDHGEQVYGAIEALLADSALRRRWQRRCRHLLVDEFQDLTPAYVLLLRLVASPELDVFGVGDDDQVIYGYDGADPGFLIDFDRWFPGAAPHALEANYRCPPAVVDAAVHLLSYNRRRIDKTIAAGRDDADPRSMVVGRHPGADLAVVCAEHVAAMIDDGAEPSSIVVLTRVNSSLIPVKAALAARGVPSNDLIGTASLQRTTVAALFAWLRIGLEPERIGRGDLLDAIRRPGRGLTRLAGELLPRRRVTVDEVVALGGRLDGRQAQRWGEFTADLEAVVRAVANGDAGGAVALLIDQIGLAGSARALDSGRGNASRSGHLDDLVAVRRAAAVHPDVSDFIPWLREVVGRPSSPDGVTLSTVHRVKGMEWPHVVVFGVDHGAMPHDLAEDVEEERRVLHVAITRATASTLVMADDARPSPFLAELDGSASRSEARLEPAAASAKPAARVGDTVRLWGGVSGIAIGRTGDQFEIRLETGARMQVRGTDIVAATPPPGRPATDGGEAAADPALVEALKSWRRETAQRTGMPAYVVFNDRTLDELARRRPQTEAELLAVNGIGPKKLEDYGDDLIAIVATDGEP